MQSSVFGIGKELISAQIKDNNVYYMVKKLSEIGIENRFVVFLDDDLNDIAQVVDYFINKTQLIITTGGLGPTFDDLTLQALALAVGEELVLNKECLSDIEFFYEKLYDAGKITDKNLNVNRQKMAYVPKNSVLLKNKVGAACGVYLKKNDLHIFCLPGVPNEMQAMFEDEVEPILKSIIEPVFAQSQIIECNINDESLLAFVSLATVEKTGVYVKTLPIGFSSDTMHVRFTAKAPTKEEAKKKLEEAIAFFENRLSRL
ncbi:Molybdopterin binding motif, CinA N-terminal domain / C-terminal domain of CinA type S [Desulfurella amilsii]|uniref:Molybdopterin binding motif, CinA N-terminal domain / C-terminal domain of CinA type S n=1 Tax=Desulfurella amilsii TaxID=1562698 RepID=A0A1X4XXR3_9BACT|nr:competence/damage-inducible protein A [Desulfurella amilsii]OSS42313.1 Molybdopterin binding motif, CinA N-terminal domain / C-terminal domain of CinA type S [Desulfurella amilsii]